jgi:hypothetical protein
MIEPIVGPFACEYVISWPSASEPSATATHDSASPPVMPHWYEAAASSSLAPTPTPVPSTPAR